LLAFRGCGDLGLVGHGGDGALVLRGLGVGHDGTVLGIDTRVILVVALAGLEGTVLGIIGDVVGAADTVETMFAEVGGVGVSGVANLDAESVASHEVMPFDHLSVIFAIAKGGGVHETTHGVTAEISAVRVHLSSIVVALDVNLGLVNETNNLGVGRGPDELNTLKSIAGDETSATAGLGAPCNHLSLGVSNDRVDIGRSPEAEVINTVDKRGLAVRLLVFGSGVAPVIAVLEATNQTLVSINLVRNLVGICIVLGSQGNWWEGTSDLAVDGRE